MSAGWPTAPSFDEAFAVQRIKTLRAFASLMAVSTAVHAADPGNPEHGAAVFKKCMICHVVTEPVNKIGPTLNGVIGRVPGKLIDDKYSRAMTKCGADHVWDEATLTPCLAEPRKEVRGTKMAFVGLRKEQDIADVIACIKTFSPSVQ